MIRSPRSGKKQRQSRGECGRKRKRGMKGREARSVQVAGYWFLKCGAKGRQVEQLMAT